MEDYAGFEPQIGEITALRTFRIGADGRLYPIYSDTAWTDGANSARCNRPPPPFDAQLGLAPHSPPEPDCTCGYYAYATDAGAAEHPHARHVLAVVACWGKVIAGTRGIRAEQARIEALWVSETVPRDLAASVATRYPTTAVYSDKCAMLAAHPPTVLDCYEIDASGRHKRISLAVRFAVFAALVVGSLPASWIWHQQAIRVIWAAEVCLFIAAAMLRRPRGDARSRAMTLLYAAMTMWLVAPFTGPAGILLIRLPLLQIATLGLIQRGQLNREAGRFPARIARLER